MKFGELKVGALFTFEGQTYLKTSPMIGRNETTGEQKFLRRSMAVTLSEISKETKPVVNKRGLTRSEVNSAFEEFYAHCEQCLDQLASVAEEQTLRHTREQLAQARQRFLAKIG
ncbi:MAG: hypothetical protein LJE85_01705 [Gammaproteobacteria bacterium]|nr:hypothetical protein [Gammaproteobacteria bacterium]